MMDEIVDAVARALFVDAWASEQEEKGKSFAPGTELMDVAPKTPAYVYNDAWRLIGRFEGENDDIYWGLYHKVLERSRMQDTPKNRSNFGHYLAMEAMGHGVGLEDEFPGHGLEVPYYEFMLR